MSNDLNILLHKLDTFIKKYYKNQIIRGVLLSLGLIVTLFLAVDVFEYFAWNSTLTRAILFYSFLILTLVVLVFYIAIPLLRLLRIGKSITAEEAARIIGKHFPQVEDKLLNTLQLQQMGQRETVSPERMELLTASINQKAAELKPIPFKKAIDFRKNLRYLRYTLPPLLILLVLLLVSPAFITEPSRRIVQHTVPFEKPLPYRLELLNDSLEALQRDDFTVRVRLSGEEIPAAIFLTSGNNRFLMEETEKGVFRYTFVALKGDVYFRLETDEFQSGKYRIKVLPKPVIFNFNVTLDYPAYLNKKREIIESSGDLVIPEGTKITWEIFTRDTRRIVFKTDEKRHLLEPEKHNAFRYTMQARNNFYYTLIPENEFVSGIDSLQFSVQVVKDEYPRIRVEDFKEKSLLGFIHFQGEISDDHGFHSLKFFFKTDSAAEESYRQKSLRIDKGIARQYFTYTIQADSFGLQPGQGMSYYFEVRDNDAVNGFKAAKTATYYLKLPGREEITEQVQESSEEVKNKLENAIKELEEVNRKLEQERLSLFEKKDLSWADKKKIAELLKKEEQIREQIKELNKLNKQINELEKKLNRNTDPDQLKKMEELEKMFAELMKEELEKQLEELQKELEKMDKDQLAEMLEEMKKDNQQMQNNLEQNLELFKEMEFEKRFNEAVEELKNLAEKQKQLARQTTEKEIDKEESAKKQEELKEEFRKVDEKLKEAEELNKELKQPFDVERDSTAMEDIQSDMDQAGQELQKGKQKKAAQSQQSAGEKMEKEASDLAAQMQSAQMERLAEDAQLVRMLLDNLLDLSFQQEKLMNSVKTTSENDPKYVEQAAELKKLKDDFKIVHDSLVEMSKRQASIRSFIIRESSKVNEHLNTAIGFMQDRKKGSALGQQQFAMTSMNNLALMLAESLDEMEAAMQMQSSKSGKGKCKNPGMNPSPSLQQMLQMQKQLNTKMQGNAKSKGLKGKQGLNGDSKELARMAALQGEIRRQLQQYIEELEKNGTDASGLNKLAEEIQKSEEDMVNRRITMETLQRQKDIEVRLLKSEKAQQEREKKKERESEVGKNTPRSNPNANLEYKERKTDQQDILLLRPIEMSPYYRALLNKYLYKLEKENVAK